MIVYRQDRGLVGNAAVGLCPRSLPIITELGFRGQLRTQELLFVQAGLPVDIDRDWIAG
ncbi:MAG: hypothetical protein ABIK43_06555 [candidate division WOR-3 bacterium]